ncbi:hypothetical protein ABMA70_01235 [Halobacteriovorax sp. XZX-3]|uniref:hypothetical protein n=1 Tax=unclassified Halobacteriovorax TaxID=2639665 RepID=UPI000CD14479|nr:hypothetical protein [Halobacteriovorax sp. DA5]POB14382.1 hypothetical protein C0Z22_04625 [Halobacteriovorax sp. DA5]
MGILKGAIIAFVAVSSMAATSTSSVSVPSSSSSTSTAASSTDSATTSEASTGTSWYQKLKDSPFNMQYLVEGSNNFKQSINGYSFYNYLYLGYNINKTFAVKLVPYWQTDFTKRQENADGSRTVHQQYGATQARLYVKNILTDEKNGFDLYLQNRIYYYPAATRNGSGYDVKNRLYLIGGKKITDNFKIGTYAFYENYIRNTGSSKFLENYYAAVAPTYYINDKWYTALSIEYYRTKRKTGATESETLSLSPEIGYSFPICSLSAALALEPVDFRGEDPDFVDGTLKNASLIVSAFFPVF